MTHLRSLQLGTEGEGEMEKFRSFFAPMADCPAIGTQGAHVAEGSGFGALGAKVGTLA